MDPIPTPPARLPARTARRLAAALALAALAGCERDPARDPVPTYPDSKLDAMRSVTEATLPDPHRAGAAASAPTPAR